MPIASSVLTLLSTFKDPILALCSDLKTEVEYFWDNGLPDYVDSLEKKFTNTKTFLYRNETVPFYDVFFPVSLKISGVVKKVTTYDELFGNSHYVSIIGTAGCGKTMLMKHFFLTTIKELFRIPIFIELRNLNDYEKSFTEYIYEHIFNNKLSPDKRILERLLESGQFVLLLDGYDEIYSDKKNKITDDLDKFIDRYSKNLFLVSSRPGSGIESMPRFNNYFVEQLSKAEVFLFIDKVLKDNSDAELSKKIKNVITDSFDSDYSNFLRSPLLLSMFILTFNTYPELPTRKSKFYWNVFDTLATKHDSFTKKGGYQHERKTKLQNEEFERILQWFSFKALFEGKLNFDSEYLTNKLTEIKKALKYDLNIGHLIEDLTLAISIIIIDGIEFKFPHKSIQEYFCAMLIKQQNDEVKEKIYSEKFPKLIRSSTGGYDNLWNLCNEIDRPSFLKFFVIPNLEIFKQEVADMNPIIQLKKFYEFSGLGDSISFEDDHIIDIGVGSVYYTTFSTYSAILRYLGIADVMSFTVAELLDEASEDLNEHFFAFLNLNKESFLKDSHESNGQHHSRHFYIKDYFEELINPVLVGTNAFDKFNKIMERVNETFTEFKDEISLENQVTNSLIDLK